ncbi:hypothetical protein BH10PAT3_BH10PAT3_6830 [soil metagenome]
MLELPKPFFVLAPMDDVTETVFRQIVQECAPADLYMTEFVNVDGLMSPGRPKLLKKLRFNEKEGPLVAQLWGLKPENFEAIARQIANGSLARELCRLNDPTGSLHPDATQGDDEEPGSPGNLFSGVKERTEPYLYTVKGVPQPGNTAMCRKPERAASSASGQARAVHACPNFVGIDLNMGCPAKSEVGNGTCSALINNRPLASEIIKATQKGAGTLPVSVKTRLGWSETDYTWHEFLLGHKLTMLTVHGRTRKEMSKVPAHWDSIGEIVKIRNKLAPRTAIVGNGDVLTRAQGEELAERYDLDGIMIGRGIFTDPYVFAKESPWESKTKEERIELFRHHVELFNATWQQNERPLHTLYKFCKVYVNGFDGAKELREKIMAVGSAQELLEWL